MTMKKTLAALVLGTIVFAPAFADEAQEKAIEYRQSVFTVVGWNFKPMGAMIKGEKPFNAVNQHRNLTTQQRPILTRVSC